MRRDRGFSLLEVVIALAIFSVLLFVLVAMDRELVRLDRSARIAFFRHPEPVVFATRLRSDVLDARGFPGFHAGFVADSDLLIIDRGNGKFVVYDLREPSEVTRREFQGARQLDEWSARGLPVIAIEEVTAGERDALRVTGTRGGRLEFESILIPRIER